MLQKKKICSNEEIVQACLYSLVFLFHYFKIVRFELKFRKMSFFYYISLFVLIIARNIDLSITFQNELCSVIYPINASNVILVLINMHKKSYGTKTCGNLNFNAITDLVQINYSIELINKELKEPDGLFKGTIGKI
jgi:hypothetical protein